MTYAVKECFLTLQGEGARVGTVSVFCRFTGCNLWSGHEKDRLDARCRFCDTDFVGTDGPGGGRFASATALARHLEAVWDASVDGHAAHRAVVFTGGEPLLQLDRELIDACHALGFFVAVESNGTLPVPEDLDWLCVSPKAGAALQPRRGNELKVVWPQPDLVLEELESLAFAHFFLQPMDGPARDANTQACIAACIARPRWRLAVQLHKAVGIR